jgi:hypothetical protein
MIGWMKDLAGTLETVMRALLQFLTSVIEFCNEVPEKVPRAAVQREITMLVDQLNVLAGISNGIIENAQTLIAGLMAESSTEHA